MNYWTHLEIYLCDPDTNKLKYVVLHTREAGGMKTPSPEGVNCPECLRKMSELKILFDKAPKIS